MNVAYLCRRALIDTNLVRSNGVSTPLIDQQDLLTWTQDAVRQMEAVWRESKEDRTLTVRTSTDGSFTFEGETYATSSLQLAASTLTYTLPPDLIQLKWIRATTAAYREYVFTNMDISNPVFKSFRNVDNPGGSEIYYDVTSRRSLQLSHSTPTTCEIELGYIARLPALFIYNGETSNVATVTNADATVTTTAGTASLWVDERLSTPSVIIFNSTGGSGHPVIVSQTSTDDFILLGESGIGAARPIASFTSNTALEMGATWPLTTDSSLGYLLASAPDMLTDHYHVALAYVRHMCQMRVGASEAATMEFKKWGQALQQFRYDISGRVQEAVFVEDWIA